MKTFKSFNIIKILILIFSVNTFAVDYYVTAQFGIEDRAFVADDDTNDFVGHLKAIFQQTNTFSCVGAVGGPFGNQVDCEANSGVWTEFITNINELTVIVNPVAYGAMDDLEVRLDVTQFPGTCSDGTTLTGVACINGGSIWTPSSGNFYLHRRNDVIDLKLGVDGIAGTTDDFIIYADSSEMFPSCGKTTMINTSTNVHECDGEPLVLTIIDADIRWGASDIGPAAIQCTDSANCAMTTTEVLSRLDLNNFLDVRNNSQGGMLVGSNGVTNTILQSIDTAYPLEKLSWYSAYLGGRGEQGTDLSSTLINLDDCDPVITSAFSNPTKTQCTEAMNDWFLNLTGTDGIDAAFVGSNNNLMNDANLSSPDYAIDQISGGTLANPLFNGAEWDPKNINTMHLVSQYYSETANPIGAGHNSVRLKRLNCNFFDCSSLAGNNQNPPASIFAPPVLSLSSAVTTGKIFELSISAKNLMLDRVSEGPDRFGIALKPQGMGVNQAYSYSLVGRIDSNASCPSSPTDPIITDLNLLTSDSLLSGANSSGEYKGHPLTELNNNDEYFPWSFSGPRIELNNNSLATYYQVNPNTIQGLGVAADDGLVFQNENHWGQAGELYFMNFNTFTDKTGDLSNGLGTGLAVVPVNGCYVLPEPDCNSELACQWDANNSSCSDGTVNYSVGTYFGYKYCAYNIISDVAEGSVVNVEDVINNASASTVSLPTSFQAVVALTSNDPCPSGSDKMDMMDPNSLCISFSAEVSGEVFTLEDVNWSGDTYMSNWQIPYLLQ